jgi:hypothetical protein
MDNSIEHLTKVMNDSRKLINKKEISDTSSLVEIVTVGYLSVIAMASIGILEELRKPK